MKRLFQLYVEAFSNNTNKTGMVLQVLEIIKIGDGNELRISDGQVWVQGSLNSTFFPNIALGMLRKCDSIKDFVVESFCPPKSIQLPVSEIIGAPVPLLGVMNVNTGQKSKKPNLYIYSAKDNCTIMI